MTTATTTTMTTATTAGTMRIEEIKTRAADGRISMMTDDASAERSGAPDAVDQRMDAAEAWGATAILSPAPSPDTPGSTGAATAGEQRDPEASAAERRSMEHWRAAPGADAAWEEAAAILQDRLHLGFDIVIDATRNRAGADAALHALREEHTPESGGLLTPARDEQSIADRGLGALLGLAVGDALGTTLEFSPRDTRPRVTDMIGGGPFDQPPGGWTDDTSLALALAESLNERGGLDRRDLLDRFTEYWKHGRYSHTGDCRDIGTTTRRALVRNEHTGDAEKASKTGDTPSNGSLMRLAPVALRYWTDRGELDAAAAEQSRATHGAHAAVDACRGLAELLADAIEGRSRIDVLRPRRTSYTTPIDRILAGSYRGRPRRTIPSGGGAAETLEAALWAVGRTGTFRNAVILAVNLGEDADTVGAVTGQLAGAIYGAGAIPRGWLDELKMRDQITRAGERLLAAATRGARDENLDDAARHR